MGSEVYKPLELNLETNDVIVFVFTSDELLGLKLVRIQDLNNFP